MYLHTWCGGLIYRPAVVVLLESLKPSWIRSLSPILFELQPYLQGIRMKLLSLKLIAFVLL
jgi:hypothetical protein